MITAKLVMERFLAASDEGRSAGLSVKMDPIYKLAEKTFNTISKLVGKSNKVEEKLQRYLIKYAMFLKPGGNTTDLIYKTALEMVSDIMQMQKEILTLLEDFDQSMKAFVKKHPDNDLVAVALTYYGPIESFLKNYQENYAMWEASFKASELPNAARFYGGLYPLRLFTSGRGFYDLEKPFMIRLERAAQENPRPSGVAPGATPEEAFERYFTPVVLSAAKTAYAKLKHSPAACIVMGGLVMEDVNAHRESDALGLSGYANQVTEADVQLMQDMVGKVSRVLSYDIILAGAFAVQMARLAKSPEAGPMFKKLARLYERFFKG